MKIDKAGDHDASIGVDARRRRTIESGGDRRDPVSLEAEIGTEARTARTVDDLPVGDDQVQCLPPPPHAFRCFAAARYYTRAITANPAGSGACPAQVTAQRAKWDGLWRYTVRKRWRFWRRLFSP